jgi:hypothetical protein
LRLGRWFLLVEQRVPSLGDPLEKRKQVPLHCIGSHAVHRVRGKILSFDPELERTPASGVVRIGSLPVIWICLKSERDSESGCVASET